MKSSTLKSSTSPAIWQAKALGSNLVIRDMPDLPAIKNTFTILIDFLPEAASLS